MSPIERAAPRLCARKAAPLKALSTRVATLQLPSYEYDRRGDFACSRLPCCSHGTKTRSGKPAGDAALRKYTVPAQCPRSARTVPATVPAWKTKQCPRFSRSWKESGSLYTLSRSKNRGHCCVFQAGTVRALRGHCAGTVYSLGAALPAGDRQPNATLGRCREKATFSLGLAYSVGSAEWVGHFLKRFVHGVGGRSGSPVWYRRRNLNSKYQRDVVNAKFA